jgi:hypothetical protein
MSCAVFRGNFPAWNGRVAAQPESPLAKYLAAHPGRPRPARPDLRCLTPRQVARIRAPDANVTALADEFMISAVAAWKVKHRITYRDLP